MPTKKSRWILWAYIWDFTVSRYVFEFVTTVFQYYLLCKCLFIVCLISLILLFSLSIISILLCFILLYYVLIINCPCICVKSAAGIVVYRALPSLSDPQFDFYIKSTNNSNQLHDEFRYWFENKLTWIPQLTCNWLVLLNGRTNLMEATFVEPKLNVLTTSLFYIWT